MTLTPSLLLARFRSWPDPPPLARVLAPFDLGRPGGGPWAVIAAPESEPMPDYDLLIRGGALFTFVESAKNELKASRRFRTRHVVRAGRRVAGPAPVSDQL